MKKVIFSLIVISALTGCATQPNKIEPIPSEKVCKQTDLARLEVLQKQQKSRANSDAFGVFMIGVPYGSLNKESYEKEIGELMWACHVKKGQMVKANAN